MKVKVKKHINFFLWLFIITFILFVLIERQKIFEILNKNLQESGFVIEEIRVNDLKFLSISELSEILNIDDETRLLKLNLAEKKILLERNDSIDNVDIKLKFPNIISLNINERIPEFLLFLDKKYYLINKKGEILKVVIKENLEQYSSYVLLIGEGIRESSPLLLEFIKDDKDIFLNINKIKWVSNRRFDIIFVNGLILQLPQEKPDLAWKNFLELNKEVNFFNNKFQKIDLRVEGRMFISLDK